MILLSSLFLIVSWVFLFYMLYRATKNSSLIDTAWSLGVGVLVLFYYLLLGTSDFRQIALLICVVAWSLRLAGLLLLRMYRGHGDKRYAALDVRWSESKFLVFYMAQALAAWILAMPFYLTMQSRASATFFDVLALALFIVSFAGEILADWQMSSFRNDKRNSGKVCKRGLWRYSRHPNYFFECLVWLSFSIFALSVPFGWLGLISPAIIYLFIIKITGIPPTEEALLASKGDKYRQYQKTTNAFLPMRPDE